MVDEEDEWRVRKNGIEQARRDKERKQIQRASYFFKAMPGQRPRSRRDLLGLGETVFPIDGCD